MLVIFVVLYGLLYGEVIISQGDTTSDTQQIEILIDRYGKRRLIEFILKKKSGQITLDINGKLQTFYGFPNHSYVTPQTILIDLDKVNLSPNDLAKAIDLQESMQKKDAEERQAQARQETERLRQQTAEAEARVARAEAAERARRQAIKDDVAQREQRALAPDYQGTVDIDARTQCDKIMKGETKADRSWQPIYGPCCSNPAAMKSKEAMEKCIGQRGAEEMLRIWRKLGVKSP
jgi:hypothetical protein